MFRIARNTFRNFCFLAATAGCFCFLIFVSASASTIDGTIDSTYKYAWSNYLGWINFGNANGNVHVTNTALTGYAWSDNYGWINMAPSLSGVRNNCTSATHGYLSGYAWGENAGWINFQGVAIDLTGKFTGSATGDIIGTLTFDCANCDVRTDWRPNNAGCGGGSGGGGGGGGGETHNECNAQNQCVSVNGAGNNQCQTNDNCNITHNECLLHSQTCVAVSGIGISQCQNDSDCLSAMHNECNAQRQCAIVSGSGSNQCQTDNDCQVTHLQCQNGQCVEIAGPGINQCQIDADCVLPSHNECDSQNQCLLVDGSGPDQCQISADCLTTHNECSGFQCIIINGLGIDQCQTDDDCAAPKHNECDNQQCIAVNGTGTDECLSDSDCSSGPPPIQRRTICQDKKCLYIDEPGENECNKDSDCITLLEKIGFTPENIDIASQKITKIIQTPTGSVVSKVISTVGIAIATAETAAISFSFFDLYLSIAKILNAMLVFSGLKRKYMPWGTIYDSVTKQPLDPAHVILKNANGKIISTAITDLDGRYGFLAEPGRYQITADKSNYLFPSKKLSGKLKDEIYQNLYFGETLEIKSDKEIIKKDIPMDPIKFDWNEFAKKKKGLMKFYSRFDMFLRKITDILFIIGFIVALVSYFAASEPYNMIIMGVYVALLLLRISGIKPRPYGTILDKNTGEPLSFALVRIMLPEINREVGCKVVDKYGRYYCLVPRGRYYLNIENKNPDGSYTLIYTSPIINATKKGIINDKFNI